MTGLTAEGFLSKRLPEIKQELEQEFRDQFGTDLNFSPETIIGQLIGIESEAFAETWALLEDIYQSQYPGSASGNSLDLLVALNGIERLLALPTTVIGYLTVTIGTTVPAGSRAKDGAQTYTLQGSVTGATATAYGATISVGSVANATDYTVTIDGVNYTVTSDASATESEILTALGAAIPVDQVEDISEGVLTLTFADMRSVSTSVNLSIDTVVATGTFQADETGPIALPIGSLDEIETPIVGWQAVTNRAAGTLGRNVETDGELRVRRDESVRLRAISTIDGIAAQLRQTDDVLDALVVENSGEVTDADGLPPQHIWCIVEGGSDTEIADVIFRRKAGGIGTFGDELELAYSEVTGQPYEIRFSRPVVTPVYITVNIAASTAIPGDYIARVRNALVDFGEEFGIGENLILNRLFTPASLVIDERSYVSSVTLGTVQNPADTDNLIADTNQRFQIVAGNINVLLD
ncbi:MAG: putative baseplate protein J [Prokaryotic dsDNA virus sp.]|nr:MAG: putative baseplate protein J [Prokaryotic dsDNA virus sp.]|tara:strand:- start:1090 stop:2487 length:1398 start_codon:yes stop_codon:yes gene_type:complete